MASKKKEKRPTSAMLRGMGADQLRESLENEREALMRARFQHATAALEDTAELRTIRRQIARIATVLNEKKQGS